MSTKTGPAIRRLCALPLLTADEERALAARRDAGDRTAVDALIAHNQRLVVQLAKRYYGCGIDYPDLVSYGQFGLITAAERYDPARGTRFGTFATQWVRSTISRAVLWDSRLIRLPGNAVSDSIKARRRKMTIPEAAKAFGWTATRARIAEHTRAIQDRQIEPLDQEDYADDKNRYLPIYHDRDRIDERETLEGLTSAIARLPDDQARLVRMVYGLGYKPHTLGQLAYRLRTPLETVEQTHAAALKTLRERMEAA